IAFADHSQGPALPRCCAFALGRPNPLEAPVTTMVFLLLMMVPSREAAVGAEDLCVDPRAVWTGQKRNHVCDVLWLTESLQPREFRQLLDLGVALSLQKQIGGDRSGRHRVHGDVLATKFVREHMDESFHTGL